MIILRLYQIGDDTMYKNFQVTLTNHKNETVLVYVPKCETEREAWSRAQNAEKRYNPESTALVTKIEECESYEHFCKINNI